MACFLFITLGNMASVLVIEKKSLPKPTNVVEKEYRLEGLWMVSEVLEVRVYDTGRYVFKYRFPMKALAFQ
jgi:hypothetical protein